MGLMHHRVPALKSDIRDQSEVAIKSVTAFNALEDSRASPVWTSSALRRATEMGGALVLETQLGVGKRMRLEVLQLVAYGERKQEISADLMMSEDMVRTHVRSILGKLHPASRN